MRPVVFVFVPFRELLVDCNKFSEKHQLNIIELPYQVSELLTELDAPIRLKRHLQIVHSTAHELLELILNDWPEIHLNRELILFGAATHDIGKAKIKSELFAPGKRHETIGRELLIAHGFSQEQSRFALTHGNWEVENLTLEDLLVSLADKVWKGKRIDRLEEKVGQKISEKTESEFWEVYNSLDVIVSKVSNGADQRLNWQNA